MDDDECSMLADVRTLAALSAKLSAPPPPRDPLLLAPPRPQAPPPPPQRIVSTPSPAVAPPSEARPVERRSARSATTIAGAILGGCVLVAVALVGGATIARFGESHTPTPPSASASPVIEADEPAADPAPEPAPVAPVAPSETPRAEVRPVESPRRERVRAPSAPAPTASTPILAASPAAPIVAASVPVADRAPVTGSLATPAPAPDVSSMPSRQDVLDAMSRVQSSVHACAEGTHGVATVSLVVAGETGRVTSALVSGPFAGTAAGSCIARAVREARFEPFARSSFSLTYPFRL